MSFEKETMSFEKETGSFKKKPGHFNKKPGHFKKKLGHFNKKPGHFKKKPGQLKRNHLFLPFLPKLGPFSEFRSLTINSFLRKVKAISGPLGQNSDTVPLRVKISKVCSRDNYFQV